MALAPGTKLGPYEILSQLGAGGMGEVYKARDTRLDRFVAVKILPSHLADSPELRERFEREAKTIAKLNHPHICVLYDVGSQELSAEDGATAPLRFPRFRSGQARLGEEPPRTIHFLVMEHLEGETLAERLKKGPLPLEQVLRYAVEVSDALDKAHRAGVTHRDIKPGNIIVTKEGTKLLDFGLAKLKQEVAKATIPASEMPTVPGALTEHGTLLGTLHYMAPEQVEGKVNEIDGRSDIFAFGALVYEMGTGKRAFPGETQASVISKILQVDPPPMSELEAMTPPALDRVVKTCLAKEPEDRWQSARDLYRELKWITEDGGQAAVSGQAGMPAPLPARPGWQRAMPWAVAMLLSVVIGLAAWNLKPTPPQPVTRTIITLPPGQRLAGLEQPAVAISPDGNLLAYVASQDRVQQLYLRAMDSLEARAIPNTEGATNPFFSPDGQWVGFFAGGNMKKVSVSGGAAVTLAGAPTPRGASWGSGGSLAFVPFASGRMQQAPEERGAPQPLTRFEPGENFHRWPEWLPEGQAVLFAAATSSTNWTNAQVAVQAVETGERQNLVQGGTQPRYASSGHLLYAQAGTLMAAPFDARRLAVTGAAAPVLEGLLQSIFSGAAQYSASATGTLVYVAGGEEASQRSLVWVSRNGEEQSIPAPPRAYRSPRISPDGRRVAVTIDERESHVWLYDLDRQTSTRLTFEGTYNVNASWTWEGEHIAFQSNREGGPQNVFWQPTDGSGGPERLTTSEYTQIPNSWSPDGQFLVFQETHPTSGRDIWVVQLADRKAQPFLVTPANEGTTRISPDGRWLAYLSDESGRNEIYVQPYPGPGGKRQISAEGGTEPVWNPNGRELFYRSGDRMMAVEVEVGQASTPVSSGQAGRPVATAFSAGRPRMLFDAAQYLPTPATIPNYDVSPDGQRFLMLKPDEQEAAPTQINVVLNWFEELKQRVPTGQ